MRESDNRSGLDDSVFVERNVRARRRVIHWRKTSGKASFSYTGKGAFKRPSHIAENCHLCAGISDLIKKL